MFAPKQFVVTVERGISTYAVTLTRHNEPLNITEDLFLSEALANAEIAAHIYQQVQREEELL